MAHGAPGGSSYRATRPGEGYPFGGRISRSRIAAYRTRALTLREPAPGERVPLAGPPYQRAPYQPGATWKPQCQFFMGRCHG